VGSIVTAATATRRVALVWIDSRDAIVVRWTGTEALVERLASDVPVHGRATRHVRYDPLTRHGGGGSEQAAEERRRIEHLDRFVDEVIGRIADDEDLVLVGHGTVHERLEARVRELDRRAHRARSVEVRRADQPTERQLVAELREHVGAAPRRRHVGG
jgi:hypothetical protein